MPLPLIPIAAGMAVGSSVIGISQGFRINKQKKIYEEAQEHAQNTEGRYNSSAEDFKKRSGEYGYTKAQASETLQQAAEFLRKAKVKNRDFYVGNPQDFTMRLEELQIQAKTFQTILQTVVGPTFAAGTAAAPAGIYTAVGLFGHAGTGARIAGLSGAARHSAILANIGRTVGGTGMSAGANALSALSKISIGLSIITVPITLGVAIWDIKNANKVEAQITSAVDEIISYEQKLEHQVSAMQAIMRRISEAARAVTSAQSALAKQLGLSDPDNEQHAHAVYKLADLLGRAMDAEVITKEQAQILGIAINAPALEG